MLYFRVRVCVFFFRRVIGNPLANPTASNGWADGQMGLVPCRTLPYVINCVLNPLVRACVRPAYNTID